MTLFGWKTTKLAQPTRRVEAARRQAEVYADPSAASYQRGRALRNSPAREEVSSERQAAHDLRRSRRALSSYLGASLVIMGSVFVVLYNLSADIRVVTPAPIVDSDQYAAVLDDYYATRLLERIHLFQDRSAMTQFFLERAPEVKSVEVSSGGLAKADLKLNFRQPVVQWSSSGKTYFVDDTGVTFERNRLSAPTVTVRDDSGVPVQTGHEIINRQFLSFLGQVVAGFSKHRYTVTDVILPPGTIRQADIVLRDKPYRIKMSVDRGAGVQVEQAAQAITWFEVRSIGPSAIDVRAEQRAFYR